jgi:hypothetical protein
MEEGMAKSRGDKPLIYWVVGKDGIKHELPDGAKICVYEVKSNHYKEIWIDPKTGDVQFRDGAR